MRSRLLYLTIGLAILPVAWAAGQARPDQPQYYRQWVESQLERWEQVVQVEFRERSRRKLDNPFGVSSVQVETQVTGYPDDREYDRELMSAEVDGRRVPPRRLREFQERWDRFRRQLGRESNAFSGWRLRALLATRPSSQPVQEEYRGRDAYRVDLIPAQALANVDRITLWFAARDGRILASRTIFEPRGQRSSLSAEIEFDRIDGVDVPIRRVIEGTVQARRRLRHYTTIVTLESRFDEYRLIRR